MSTAQTGTKTRRVEQLVAPKLVSEGAGVRLRRAIGLPELDYLDPFLLLDDFSSDNPADYEEGFPRHPHRGIETVTYILAGEVEHRDSLGNEGRITPGDVQWMTAGRGIMHEEMPNPREGRMAGFQLWVNLPASLKNTDPRYQNISGDEIPIVHREGVGIHVIAGQVGEVRGPVLGPGRLKGETKEIEPLYLDVAMAPGSSFRQPVERGHTLFAYLFKGQARFGVGEETEGEVVAARRLVVFGDGDEVRVETGDQSARFLLVAGAPLNEPIARYGPFVMNTQEEVAQTLRELRAGTFGR